MAKKEQTTESAPKQALTIKVTTLAIVGVTLFAGIAAGWNLSSVYHQNVQDEAAVLTQSFTKN